ncbi:MAG: glycosyltransferase family 4 protein [Armatimonadota bacterium]|nr:glycosyltransferase family 4 protein [Armatimonadota bacterium]
MRVLIVSPYPLLNPVQIKGGVEAAAYYLAKGLSSLENVQVSVLCDTKALSNPVSCEDGRVLVHYVPNPKIRLIPNVLLNVYRLRRLIESINPDIVHSHAAWGTLASVKANYPTVHTIHAVVSREEHYSPKGVSDKLSVKLLGYLLRKAIVTADECIAVSSYVRNVYASLARRITVVPNAVDDCYFDVTVCPSSCRLLQVGSIGKLKNTLGLVRAFGRVKKAHPNAELVIAGPVRDEAYYRNVLECVRTQGLQGSVYFLGQVDQTALVHQYASAGIVCTFSWHETFSLALAQGMAAGNTLVGTDCGGPSDFIVDGATGYLVSPGDEEAFADRCDRLLSNPSLAAEMGSRAKLAARDRFRKEVVAAQTLEVYRRVLEETRTAASSSTE